MAERKLEVDWESYLGPVAIAQFIEIGWVLAWPMTWSKVGKRAIRNGYGRWNGNEQSLPYVCEASAWGAAMWQGRKRA